MPGSSALVPSQSSQARFERGADLMTAIEAGSASERLLELMAIGFLALDHRWAVRYVNAEGERILGRPRRDLLARNLWEAFPGAEELDFGRQYHHAMESGEAVAFEEFYPGLGLWFEVRAARTPDGLGVYFLDITARRAATRGLVRDHPRRGGRQPARCRVRAPGH